MEICVISLWQLVSSINTVTLYVGKKKLFLKLEKIFFCEMPAKKFF